MNKARWNRIEQLFISASELPESERMNFLAEHCKGDGELFDEVASLIGVAGQTDGFLSEGAFEIGLQVLADPGQVLRSGQQFGHFMITELLGKGGMGEVYLAEDTRLKRMVALKVLPSGYGADEEGTRRLMQEAKTASVLNHPNILTIYDIGEIEGQYFVASEFIEGLTLRDLLRTTSPVDLSRARKIFSQICAALTAAHSAGIVHRDIKPENVMIRDDGLVKVLDFGLAKLAAGAPEKLYLDGGHATNRGMILGTVAYMSPEQVRGKETDARSDIWSMGVLLCEMLTGALPFEGETTSDRIAAILKNDPDLPYPGMHDLPNSVMQVIAKSLEKSPSRRYASVAMMAEELELASLDTDSAKGRSDPQVTGFRRVADTESTRAGAATDEITSGAVRKRFSGKTIYAGAAVAVALTCVGAAALFFLLRDPGNPPMTKMRVAGSGYSVAAAISPDGKLVAHVIVEKGSSSLHLKDLETGSESVLLKPGPMGIGGLIFSKDSRYVCFLRGREPRTLYRVSVSGGELEKVAEGVDSAISFSPSGAEFAFIRLLQEQVTALMVRDANGDERQIAVRKGLQRFGLEGVAWSPDGTYLANAVGEVRGMTVNDIAIYPAAGGEPTLIAPDNWREIQQLVWLPDGSGLIAPAVGRKGENYLQLWLFPAGGGQAKAITGDLIEHQGVSISDDGTKLLTVQWQNRSNIWKIPGGRSEQAGPISHSVHARYRAFAIAPDGRIVFPSNDDSEGNRDIWIMNPDGTAARRLTKDQGNNLLPCITSDGRYIVVSSNRADSNSYHLWRMNIDGGEPRQLTFGKSERGPVCGPDPSVVYFHTGSPAQGMQVSRIGRISIEGGETTVLTNYPSTRSDVSPDGKYFASVCIPRPGSKISICIIPINGGSPAKTFELEQLSYLRWRPDGSAITFTKSIDGVSNFWEQPVGGGAQKQLTRFAAETITNFEWSGSGDLYCSRGYEINDPVLLSNFR